MHEPRTVRGDFERAKLKGMVLRQQRSDGKVVLSIGVGEPRGESLADFEASAVDLAVAPADALRLFRLFRLPRRRLRRRRRRGHVHVRETRVGGVLRGRPADGKVVAAGGDVSGDVEVLGVRDVGGGRVPPRGGVPVKGALVYGAKCRRNGQRPVSDVILVAGRPSFTRSPPRSRAPRAREKQTHATFRRCRRRQW